MPDDQTNRVGEDAIWSNDARDVVSQVIETPFRTRHVVLTSLACYLVSLCLPCIGGTGPSVYGIFCLLYGWVTLLDPGWPCWVANPFWLFGLIALAVRGNKELIIGLLVPGTLLALTTIPCVLLSRGNAFLHIGFLFWIASFLVPLVYVPFRKSHEMMVETGPTLADRLATKSQANVHWDGR